MALDSDGIKKIIDQMQSGYHVVDAETEEREEEELEAGIDFDASVASVDEIRSKIAQQLQFEPDDLGPLQKAGQFVLVEPDVDIATDRTAPMRRVTIVSSETEDIIAKQG